MNTTARLPIYVLTNDRHTFLLKGFAACFNTFWPDQEVTVFGYSPPKETLPANFHFVSLGDQRPADEWSDGLLDMLNRFAAPQFILLLEDYWLSAPVETDKVAAMTRFALKEGDRLLRVDLSGDRARFGAKPSEIFGEFIVVDSPPGTHYQMSFQAAIWNRDQMRVHIRPGWNPWQAEILGTQFLNLLGDAGPKVYGTAAPALIYQPVYRVGRGTLDTSHLPEALRSQIGDVNQ